MIDFANISEAGSFKIKKQKPYKIISDHTEEDMAIQHQFLQQSVKGRILKCEYFAKVEMDHGSIEYENTPVCKLPLKVYFKDLIADLVNPAKPEIWQPQVMNPLHMELEYAEKEREEEKKAE